VTTIPSFDLESLGFSPFFQSSFSRHVSSAHARALLAGRVALEHRGEYVLFTAHGEVHAELAGRLRHTATARAELPAVGDWVVFHPTPDRARATIDAVLPRRTAFLRGAAGGATEAQVVAANVDVLFLLCAFGADLNARRVERYLTLARATGAEPVLVLTKVDLAGGECASIDEPLADLAKVARGVPIYPVSSVTGDGIRPLRAHLEGHRTGALLGSSGAGKSTLVNSLAAASRQATGPMGADGRGMHTTTHRELIVLPRGGLVIDTPGMRELRLWDAADGLDETFRDVTSIAASCRFRDCAHEREPGCAVRAALDDGEIDPERWGSYVKLERELASLAVRKDARAAADQKKRLKLISRAMRERYRAR
jgi:ribosome biogenesis GTPase / thiamine phosphate phosphatase